MRWLMAEGAEVFVAIEENKRHVALSNAGQSRLTLAVALTKLPTWRPTRD